MAGRNGAAAKKKKGVIKSSKDAGSPVPCLLGQDLCYAVISTKSWRSDERNSPPLPSPDTIVARAHLGIEITMKFLSVLIIIRKVPRELSRAKSRLLYFLVALGGVGNENLRRKT